MDTLQRIISEAHEHLGELFLLHEECLLERRFGDALTVLQLFQQKHHAHMNFEDKELLPRYVDMDEPGRWGARIYQAEHGKIVQLLNNLLERVVALTQQTEVSHRDVIELLDQEKTFKNVCEHHELREEECLLMQLDQHLDGALKNELAASFGAIWQSLEVAK